MGVVQTKNGAASPLLLAVDRRAAGGPRNATLTFNASAVGGWTSLLGDDASGFGSCAKFVLGPTATVELEAGDAALLTVTLFEE